MDDAERAEAHEQLLRNVALNTRKPTLSPVGHCYYCDETVQRGVLFCSTECAHDWESEQKIRRIIGKTVGRA